MKEPCGVGLVPWWFLPRPLSRLPAPAGGSPPEGVFADRRDNGHDRKLHSGRTRRPGDVCVLCGQCAGRLPPGRGGEIALEWLSVAKWVQS